MIWALMLIAATQEGSARVGPRTTPQEAWTTCVYGFAMRVDDVREGPSIIADAAIDHCSFAEGQYWRMIYTMYAGARKPRAIQLANSYMAKRRKAMRVSLISDLLDLRATAAGARKQ